MVNRKIKPLFFLGLLMAVISCVSNRDQLTYSHVKPIYTNHSFFGSIKSSIIINLPVKNDSLQLYNKGNARGFNNPNSYFKEYYLPLDGIHEYIPSRLNLYDSLGNMIFEIGLGPKEKIFSSTNYVDSVVEGSCYKRGKRGHSYRYDLLNQNMLINTYGKGQRMPAFFKTHNLNPPNQIPVSYSKDINLIARPYLLECRYIIDTVSNTIIRKYKSDSHVNNAEDILSKNFFESLTLDTMVVIEKPRFYGRVKEYVFSKDSIYELNNRAKVDYTYGGNGQVSKKTYTPIYDKSSLGRRCYMLEGRGAFSQSREDFHGHKPLEEIFTYDNLNRLKTHYYNLENPSNYKSTFYYSGKNTIPDSIWVFYPRVSIPGDNSTNVYTLILDKEGKVTEVHFIWGKMYYDDEKQTKFKRLGVLEKRILKYSNYDAYGNWTKVDIYAWLSDKQLSKYQKTKAYKEFWSQMQYVGSQERILEYYKE